LNECGCLGWQRNRFISIMLLYHFTMPANVLRIVGSGLEPASFNLCLRGSVRGILLTLC